MNKEELKQLAKTTNDIKLLEELSNNEDVFVKGNVAHNPNTSVSVLEKLSKKEENSFVKICVIENKNTPLDILEKLSKDPNLNVRFEILNHPNVSKEIVEKLCEDKDDDLSLAAMSLLNTFEHNLKDTINEVSNYNIDSNENKSTNSNKHKH